MPHRAPGACRPGCPHPRRGCPDHPPDRWADGLPGRQMPPGWGHTRARVLHRDGYRCRRCGNLANEVHHIEPGNEAEEMLVSLCSPCHLDITLAQAAAARALARP